MFNTGTGGLVELCANIYGRDSRNFFLLSWVGRVD